MINAPSSLTYPYKWKKKHFIIATIAFCYFAWIAVLEAVNNKESLKYVLYQNVIEFSFNPNQATIILWIHAAYYVFCCFFCIYLTCVTWLSKAKIILTNTSIFIPGHFNKSKGDRTIFFDDITSLETIRVFKTCILKIVSSKGKVCINDDMLPQKSMLDEIRNHINMRIKDKS